MVGLIRSITSVTKEILLTSLMILLVTGSIGCGVKELRVKAVDITSPFIKRSGKSLIVCEQGPFENANGPLLSPDGKKLLFNKALDQRPSYCY